MELRRNIWLSTRASNIALHGSYSKYLINGSIWRSEQLIAHFI